ncbi:MAG: RNB domain-containing ribonuclease [Kineosporiaceae bacterium]
MVRRSVQVTGRDEASVAALQARFAQIRTSLQVPAEFPAEVLAAAAEAAQVRPSAAEAEVDLREIPFVTVDPPGSTDLDQALHLARRPGSESGPGPGGYHVDYAIADVPTFVAPGSPVDVEARRRGQTLYAPDRRTPLHPPVLSEGAASLLEGQDRSAFVWRFDLLASGEVESVALVRAMVRSRRRLDYAGVQAAADAHPGHGADPEDLVAEQAVLLREIGTLRQEQERARGGASLPLPEQQVDAAEGRYALTLRPLLPAEDWNAQLSLMTGMAAAKIMLDGGAGILRTLPAPDARALERFRRQAGALGVRWPHEMPYGDLLRGMRRDVPRELALMHEAGALFRGAGYSPLDPRPGAALPTVTTHAAVAAPYAHVTAPLRRLVDRFGLLACHALVGGRPVPEWVLAALPELPKIMATSDDLAGQLERRCTDLVEAAVLAHRVGEVFDAVVVDQNRSGVKVQLLDPAVLASAVGEVGLGQAVRVRLAEVDLDQGGVRFVIEDGARTGQA